MCVHVTVVAGGEKISITYSECVFVALLIQHAARMRLLFCHLWPARLYIIPPCHLINGTILEDKALRKKKVCFHFHYNFCLKYFSFQEELSEI
jgi:hypothetical protein